jgi:hypothetical protein
MAHQSQSITTLCLASAHEKRHLPGNFRARSRFASPWFRTSAIHALVAFSGGHHPAYNFLAKSTCCNFAQAIGVTSDPRITFPYLLKTRASTLGLRAALAGFGTTMASLA